MMTFNKEKSLLLLNNILNQVTKITDAAWADISKSFEFKNLKKGDYFVTEGNYSSDVGFVLNGVLRAFYRTPEGVEYNKTFFVENSFAVTLAAVLQKTKSQLNFQALTDCELLVADYYKITSFYSKHRCIESLVRIMIETEWVVKKEQRELRLVLDNAEERYKYFTEEYPGLENRIPQYHIASHLGITPIQLSRIRAKIANK